MNKTIIASIMPEESRMALVEDGEPVEYVLERGATGHLVGNIYKGKVKNVLPGMQAAFIDIGGDKNAYLYVENVDANEGRLTVGQDILIQIVKDASGSKGPRATTGLMLPGRYAVLAPYADGTGVSRRIEDEAERQRLRQLADKVKPEGMGVIVRTAAAGCSETELARDVEYLYNLWAALAARAKRSPAPTLLYRDVDLAIRIVRDYLDDDVTEVVIDNRDAYGRVCDLLQHLAPAALAKVKFYEDPEDVFVHYGIAADLSRLLKREVELACGGFLVIDQTEALTVIDVNTGRFVGDTSLGDTVFRVNMEAAAEIARQLRLRDIGGIIIVDFIDMAKEEHKQTVLAFLAEKMRQDRTRSKILGLTSLGLVEITRKKGRPDLNSLMYSECPCCEGRGRIQSPETVAINIRRRLRQAAAQRKLASRLVIQAHPQVVEILSRQGELARLERDLARKLTLEAVPTMHPECYSILYDKE
ncbi:Rne/Rng family ribonuclease [Sporolituus thermophilus]|uniref:Ribonuclease G n=1 Tax=Sporolituus thermophilus DSM 23256 TaxID=1123285 RepID=A0A1G7J945_9FIRM|nr:Rne/Rng family ribonuclease [Sporolituus thermophilus]SDF21450.1 ribonuclease G [Sporolituus thermophilus DSM 23256]